MRKLVYLFVAAIVAIPLAASAASITFPIPELGNCANQDACRTFCNDTANQTACAAFAQSHGLASSTAQVAKAADDRIVALLKTTAGPGGCTTKDQCREYCGDFSHAQECAAFAQAHGLTQAPPPTKFVGAFATSTTPGNCSSKDACAAYCNDAAHQEECIAFAKARGIIDKQQASTTQESLIRLRQGIDNAPQAVQACVQSALGPDVISQISSGSFTPTPDLAAKIKNCFDTMKPQIAQEIQQFIQNNPQAANCLTKAIGADALAQIKQGNTPPTAQIADKVKACFETNRGEGDQGKSEGHAMASTTAPAPGLAQKEQVIQCVSDKLGADVTKQLLADTSKITPDQKQVFAACLQSVRPAPVNMQVKGDDSRPQQPNATAPSLQSLVEQAKDCLTSKLGADAVNQLASGTLPQDTGVLKAALQACVPQQFAPPQSPAPAQTNLQNPFNQQGGGDRPRVNTQEIMQKCLAAAGVQQEPGSEITGAQQEQVTNCIHAAIPQLQQQAPQTNNQGANALSGFHAFFAPLLQLFGH